MTVCNPPICWPLTLRVNSASRPAALIGPSASSDIVSTIVSEPLPITLAVSVGVAGRGLVAVPAALPHQRRLLFSCQIVPFTYANPVTFAVVVSTMLSTATCPPLVIVQVLPLASVIAEVVPVTTVWLADCVCVGMWSGMTVWEEIVVCVLFTAVKNP